eukprot:766450-Hanusia_phi.AAC.2
MLLPAAEATADARRRERERERRGGKSRPGGAQEIERRCEEKNKSTMAWKEKRMRMGSMGRRGAGGGGDKVKDAGMRQVRVGCRAVVRNLSTKTSGGTLSKRPENMRACKPASL